MNQMYGFEGEVKAKYPFVLVVCFSQTLEIVGYLFRTCSQEFST